MASASHGAVTLPIWSEPTTTPGPIPLNIHVNDGFVTVVLYPRPIVTIFPEPENGFDSYHRACPWIEEKVDSQNQQDGKEQTEEPAPPRNYDALKYREDMKDEAQGEIQSKPRFLSENAITSRAASTPIPSACQIQQLRMGSRQGLYRVCRHHFSSNMLPSSVSSLVPSYSRSQHASNASQSSGRYFVQNPVRSQPRMINDFGSSRRNHQRSYSSRSMAISPIEESPDSLGIAPPTSVFRFSDAS